MAKRHGEVLSNLGAEGAPGHLRSQLKLTRPCLENFVCHSVPPEPTRESTKAKFYVRKCFVVSGNTSVLPWYFRDRGPTLVTNNSLRATLSLHPSGKVWTITLTGTRTDSDE